MKRIALYLALTLLLAACAPRRPIQTDSTATEASATASAVAEKAESVEIVKAEEPDYDAEQRRRLAEIRQRRYRLLERKKRRLEEQLIAWGVRFPQTGLFVPYQRDQLAYWDAKIEKMQSAIQTLEKLVDEKAIEVTVREISGQTAKLRRLELKKKIEFNTLSRSELMGYLMKALDKEIPPQEMQATEFILTHIGLTPFDLNLREVLLGFYTDQVGGLYDDESKKLYVMEDFPLKQELSRVILAHEICHAIQDQYYDLLNWEIHPNNIDEEGGNDDRAMAAACVAEGDATILMGEWAAQNLSIGVLLDLPKYLSLNQKAMSSAPQPLIDMFIFPYMSGMYFMQTLRLEEFERPGLYEQPFMHRPESTEQIMHPEKYYIFPDPPTPVTLVDISKSLDDGWQRELTNVMGESMIKLMFNQCCGVETAYDAHVGWDGDRLELYRHTDGGWLFGWVTVWDSPHDAEQFQAAYEQKIEWHKQRCADAGRPEPFGSMTRNGAVVIIAEGSAREPVEAWLEQAQKQAANIDFK
ncbi:hypothetical protein JXA32_08820 [Candidatus Sumerlaeota bacterium]|nr:hypothetical protein [Candidatus Sumerlaeota bacterium]